MNKKLKWWVMERHNPQLGVYYSSVGQITKKEAADYKKARYGTNSTVIMHSFDTEEGALKFIENKS